MSDDHINPAQSMFAQVAISNGDAITGYKLLTTRQNLNDAVVLLAQSQTYKTSLPAALKAFSAAGDVVAQAINQYPEFSHRTYVAASLADILMSEGNSERVRRVAANLADPRVQTQIADINVAFPQQYRYSNTAEGVNPQEDLVLANAIRGKYETIDRLLQTVKGSAEDQREALRRVLSTAVEHYNAAKYDAVTDAIFTIYAELPTKSRISNITAAVETNNVELMHAIKRLDAAYNAAVERTKGDDRHFPSCFRAVRIDADNIPKFEWDGNSVVQCMDRIAALYVADQVRFVYSVVDSMKGTEKKRLELNEQPPTQNYSPRQFLEAAEKMVAAKLPYEVFLTVQARERHESVRLPEYVDKILAPHILTQIHKLGKAGAKNSVRAIACSALREEEADVTYVAQNIGKLLSLPKPNELSKTVRESARPSIRLKCFFPEGVDYRKLTMGGKEAVTRVAKHMRFANKPMIDELLRNNLDALNRMVPGKVQEHFPRLIGFEDSQFSTPERKLKELQVWLGLIPAE